MKGKAKYIVVIILLLLTFVGTGCDGADGSTDTEAVVTEDRETPPRMPPSADGASPPVPVAEPDVAAPAPVANPATNNGNGPIESCRLAAAAFSNVGLGVPRNPGFVPSVGTVEAVVLFADFADAPANETPADTFARVSPGAPDFFRQNSYGRMTLDLQPHLNWLRLSQPSSHYAGLLSSGDGHLSFIQEAVDLADTAVDFSSADLVVVLANPEATAIPFGPAFGAGAGFPGIEADGVSIPSGVTSGADLATWGYLWLNHEMGHTMTLPDLYAYDGADDHRFVGTFGLMGLIDGQAPELFAFERWQLGWLDDGQIICQTSGEGTTELLAIEQPGGTKAVIVPIGETSAIVVESRRAVGYDEQISKEGALVYLVDTSVESGHGPIQVLPARDDDPMRGQSILAEGESFTLCHVTITAVTAGADGDTVRVTVNEQNPCAGETAVAQENPEPQADPCANIPSPTGAGVMVRFANQNGAEVIGFWEDGTQSPAQLSEYFRIGNNVTFDQETFGGDKWVVQDSSGATLLSYTASDAETQCVVITEAGAQGGFPQVQVTVSSANLREGPGTVYAIAGIAREGDVLTVLAKNRDGSWYNVELADGLRAWISSSVTAVNGQDTLNEVEVAATVPAPPTPLPVSPSATPVPAGGGGGNGGDTPKPTKPPQAQPTFTPEPP